MYIEKISLVGLRITMGCDTDFSLPNWLGSTIRGAVATEMLKRFCFKGSPDCENCSSGFGCSAKTMLMTSSVNDSELGTNPYVVRNYSTEGKNLTFELLLFGGDEFLTRDIIRVLSEGLCLGKRKYRFSLKRISDIFTGAVLFDGSFRIMPEPINLFSKELSTGTLTVDIKAPLRCKAKAQEIDFDYFFRACTRRYTSILKCCGIDFDIDFEKLFSSAKEVKTVSSDLKIKQLERYSSRTDEKMKIYGFTGKMVFDGDFSCFSEILTVCEVLGTGKLCVMGLGQFSLDFRN